MIVDYKKWEEIWRLMGENKKAAYGRTYDNVPFCLRTKTTNSVWREQNEREEERIWCWKWGSCIVMKSSLLCNPKSSWGKPLRLKLATHEENGHKRLFISVCCWPSKRFLALKTTIQKYLGQQVDKQSNKTRSSAPWRFSVIISLSLVTSLT